MNNYIKELDKNGYILGLEKIEGEELKYYIKKIFSKAMKEERELEDDRISTYVCKYKGSMIPSKEFIHMNIFRNGSMIGYIQFEDDMNSEASFIRLKEEMYASIVNKIRTLIR